MQARRPSGVILGLEIVTVREIRFMRGLLVPPWPVVRGRLGMMRRRGSSTIRAASSRSF
jgi:hypothetical protein